MKLWILINIKAIVPRFKLSNRNSDLKWCEIFSLVCSCYEEGTMHGNECSQDEGHCVCKDGYYGYKCLFGELKYFRIN